MTKHNFQQIALLLLAVTTFLLLTGCEAYKPSTPPPAYQGTWVGLGHNQLSNEFLDQRQVAFFMEIKANGNISGYVGDATFNNTKLLAPAWFMKVLGNKKYKAVVTLNGYIVNRESFRREGGTLTFEGIKDDELVCHFSSTGSQASVRNMVLSVNDIRLHHPR
jgi:hypothetical protein